MFTKTTKNSLEGGTVHDLPSDMQKAILADKQMLDIWQTISPIARNEWICWTITCAKPETRVKHIVVMRDKMHKGERRPCCWIGCIHRTDKAVSPSVKAILAKKSGAK